MAGQLIHLLDESCYRTFVAPVGSAVGGGVEDVHIATVDDPASSLEQVYAKMYKPGDIEKGLFNEVAGFLFASALGLPQPRKAWILRVPLEALPPENTPEWLRSLHSGGTSSYLAFATSRVNGPSAALELAGGAAGLSRLVADVRKWDALPQAVSLDNTISNVDRHLNNLLRLGKNSYCLIDNGRLAHESGHWSSTSLDSGANYVNKLCQHVWNERPTAAEFKTAVLASREHSFGFGEIIDELRGWGSALLGEAECDAFVSFLEERAENAEYLISDRYNSAA